MDDSVRGTLRDILTRHGRDLIEDPKRCESVFEVLPSSAKLERTGLIMALREGIPQRLIATPADHLTPTALKNHGQRLSEASGLREDVANWAVETWASALSLPVASAAKQPQPQVKNATAPVQASKNGATSALGWILGLIGLVIVCAAAFRGLQLLFSGFSGSSGFMNWGGVIVNLVIAGVGALLMRIGVAMVGI